MPTELTAIQAIQRFKENEQRARDLVNKLGTYNTDEGIQVETLPSLLARKNVELTETVADWIETEGGKMDSLKEAVLDFRGRYYGPLPSDPIVDPLGGTVTKGDLYMHEGTGVLRAYDGSQWRAAAGGNAATMTPQAIAYVEGQKTYVVAAPPATYENSLVFAGGIKQDKSVYTLVGTALTFAEDPKANIDILSFSTLAIGQSDAATTQYIPDDGQATSVQEYLRKLASSIGSSLLGFIQTGVGVVRRSIQDKLRESVSVKDFGAIGDGVTDDTAAIQAAHAAHRAVFYPEPSAYYKITSTVTLNPGAKFIGEEKVEGNDSTVSIKYEGVAGGKMFACDAVGSAKGIIMEQIVLDGNNLAATGISLNTYRSRIEKNTLKNFTGAAIDFPDSAAWGGENRVCGNIIHHCATGVKGGSKSLDGFLCDNVIYACTNHVDLATDGGWLVSGNHFYSSGVASPAHVTVRSASGGRITNNVFDTPPTNAIALTVSLASCSTVVRDNVFTGQASTVNFVKIDVAAGTSKLYVGGNSFYAPTGGNLAYCIAKSGAGVLAGTIGENMYVNILSTKKYSLDASTILFDIDGGSLTSRLDAISMRNIKLTAGFGAPVAADPTGSLHLAYNSVTNADKGCLYYRYAGGWKKVPVLDKWHVDSTAAPTTGDWLQGDIVFNEAPVAGGFAGWICVASGTPGTWKTFGAITV